MDKSDLDFLVDSQDADLLYKYILEAICSKSRKIQDGVGWYSIDRLAIHSLYTCILYRSTYNSANINRIDKYVMEL